MDCVRRRPDGAITATSQAFFSIHSQVRSFVRSLVFFFLSNETIRKLRREGSEGSQCAPTAPPQVAAVLLHHQSCMWI